MARQDSPQLLTFRRRLRYALTPKKLYARYRAWRDLRRYEPELHLLPFLVDPNRHAIDGGAHRGSYCFFLSRMCPQVYAFEPNPVMFDYLRRVVAANVKIFNVALSDAQGEATFTVPRAADGEYRNTSGTLQAAAYRDDVVQFKVPVRRLDDMGLENVGFIKLDVEGHELAAIAGARNIIERDRPVLLVEIMDRLTGRPAAESVAAIEALGYRAMAVLGHRLLDVSTLEQELQRPHAQDDPAFRRGHNYVFFPVKR